MQCTYARVGSNVWGFRVYAEYSGLCHGDEQHASVLCPPSSTTDNEKPSDVLG